MNERARELQQRQGEIAARVLREREMRQRIELEEETTAGVTGNFASLQQELDYKTQRYVAPRYVSPYVTLRVILCIRLL